MKKIAMLFLVIINVLLINAYASLGITESGYSPFDKIVYIRGDLCRTPVKNGNSVSILLTDKTDGSIKYIDEIPVGSDGKYYAKFKFDGNVNDCELAVREGENDVTSSVTVTTATQSTLFSVGIKSEFGGSVIKANEIITPIANIANKYGTTVSYCVLLGFYNDDGSLISAKKVMEGETSFDEIFTVYKGDEEITVPENTSAVKAFVLNNLETIVPLANSVTKKTDDMTFGGEGNEVTVAFVGDSITHQERYVKFIEHYYHTRYPDRKINFVNKGIGGNSAANVINRFGWDICDDELTGRIDEATLYIGVNDIMRELYNGEADYEMEKKQRALTNYENNIRTLIRMFKERDISLTLICPAALDDTEGFAKATGPYNPTSNSVGLKNAVDILKKIAAEYNIPIIDLWTPTTEIADSIRATGYDDEIIAGRDRVHPNDLGAFYMAYEFVLQQDGGSVVSSVSIDAASGDYSAQNADIILGKNSSGGVEYIYKPKSLPLAYNDSYKKWEEWGVPVSEKINLEEIKVSSLEDGVYSVSLNGQKLTAQYTNAELERGINISVEAENPNQIRAKELYNLLSQKDDNESAYRTIALTEQFMISHLGLTADDIRRADYSSLKAYALQLVEMKNAAYNGNYYNYIGKASDGVTDKITFGYKPNQLENSELIKKAESEIRAMSNALEYEIKIKKIS